MRIGDNIKCINIDACHGLTLGKIYRVIKIEHTYNDPIVITNDGTTSAYISKRFINISEERRNKLEKLSKV